MGFRDDAAGRATLDFGMAPAGFATTGDELMVVVM